MLEDPYATIPYPLYNALTLPNKGTTHLDIFHRVVVHHHVHVIVDVVLACALVKVAHRETLSVVCLRLALEKSGTKNMS